jgi:predicted ATPase/DNA-binding CsgD family transcriptional regulator
MHTSLFAAGIHNAPAQPTPFFGRRDEVAALAARLADPACRLVTLTGPGGIGKTRLALQAAGTLSATFAHGVWFVPLQPLNSAALLPTVVADVLAAPFAAVQDPTAQLHTYLADKALLLILDNFEHLLNDGGAALLPALLQAAPALKLLVTSRAALKLQEEWLYPVGGLPVPPGEQGVELEHYAGIQLFVERATRARGDFSVAAERAGLVRVCRLVEGVPLAMELAAAWTPVLRCDGIAAEIERNLHFLQTDLRNMPDRHRSLQAVFDQSWALLDEEERGIFARLAVFHGGFRQEAAAHVATAALPVLAALVNKSLLQVAPDGRYQFHALLRQYAAERLAGSAAAAQMRDRHAAYYLAFLQERNAAMNGGRQLQATAEIAAELDNVRAAWQWAVERGHVAALVGATNALYLFWQFRSRYGEGVQLLEPAVQRLEEGTLAEQPGATLLLTELGWLYVRLGRLEHAQALFERGAGAYRRLRAPSRDAHSSDPRLGLGLLASLRGDYAAARDLVEAVRQASARAEDRGNQLLADYLLAGIYLAQGQHEAAHRHAQTAYAQAHAAHNRWFMAYCLNALGNTARALGEHARARGYYQAGYAIREEFGDAEGMAVALAHLGAVASGQEDWSTAEDHYRRAFAIYREINDQGGLVTTLDGLGRARAASGQIPAAARYLHQALEIATRARFIALRLSLLISIGQLLLRPAAPARGLAILRFVCRHPATTQEARDRARRLLDQHEDSAAPEDPAPATAPDLDTMSVALLAELAAWAALREAGAPPGPSPSPGGPALIEPLTPRERELLQLLAAGRSYQEIAGELTLAVGTVKSHAHNIYGKLGVSNRVQAAARAAELGLL